MLFSSGKIIMILGITGGFGCGKSSVLRFFESKLFFTLDADAVCRDFYLSEEPHLMDCIRTNFGKEMFLPDGSVDRGLLGRELFTHPDKMKLITDVIYPLLTAKIVAAINECRQADRDGAFELPLLYEAGFENFFDKILTVWCPDDLRKKRLAGRHFCPAEVDRRDRMQMPPAEKLERADFAVINNDSPAQLTAQLEKLLEIIKI